MPTTQASEPQAQEARTHQFAEYIRQAVIAAGYDIDSPRGGGKKALARATGMSQTSVGRMLAGQTLPDPNNLERLAEVLNISLPELLVRSGVISRKSSSRLAPSAPSAPPASSTPLTPARAAQQLGITNPENVRFFETTVQMLLDRERTEGEGRE